MAKQKITRVAQLKSATDFTNHLSAIDTDLPFKKNLSIMFFSSLFSPLYYSRSISRQLFQLISCAGWHLFGGLVCHCASVCMYLFILLFVVLNNVFICNYVITCLHCCGWNHFYTAAAYCRLPNNL